MAASLSLSVAFSDITVADRGIFILQSCQMQFKIHVSDPGGYSHSFSSLMTHPERLSCPHMP